MTNPQQDALALANLIREKHFSDNEQVRRMNSGEFADWYGVRYPNDKRLTPITSGFGGLEPLVEEKQNPQPHEVGGFPASIENNTDSTEQDNTDKPPTGFYPTVDYYARKANEGITKAFGGLSDKEYWRRRNANEEISNVDKLIRSVATGTEGVISSAPENILELGMAMSPFKALRLTAPVAGSVLTGVHEVEKGGDATQVVGAASGNTLGWVGGLLGGEVAKRYGLGKIGQAAGSYLGNLAGGSSSGLFNQTGDAERDNNIVERVKFNLDEMTRAENLGSLAVGALAGSAIHYAVNKGRISSDQREALQDKAASYFPEDTTEQRDAILTAGGWDKRKTQEALDRNPELFDAALEDFSKVRSEFLLAKEEKRLTPSLKEGFEKAKEKLTDDFSNAIFGYGSEADLVNSHVKRIREKTFSLDAAEPTVSFLEKTFQNQSEAIEKTGRMVSIQEAGKLITGGDKQLNKFLDSIHTESDRVQFFSGLAKDVGNGFYDPKTKTIGINFQNENVNKAFGTFVHEKVHSAMDDLATQLPEEALRIHEIISKTSVDERKAVFKAMQDVTGIKDINIDYLSGVGYESDLPRITNEFLSGVSEFIARDVAMKRQSSSLVKLIHLLPEPLRIPVMKLVDRINNVVFSKSGVGKFYEPRTSRLAEETFSFIQKNISKEMQVLDVARRTLSSLDYMGFKGVEDSLIRGVNPFGSNERLGSVPETKGLVKDLKEIGQFAVSEKPEHLMVRIFGNFIQMQNKFPEVSDVTQKLLYFASKVGSEVEDVKMRAWGYDGRNVSANEAINRLNSDVKFYERNPTAVDRIGKVFDLDAQARQKKDFDTSKLQTEDQMRKLGLSERDVNMVKKIYNLTELTQKQELVNKMKRDDYLLAKTIKSYNPEFSKEKALAFAESFRVAKSELGMAELRVVKARSEEGGLLKDSSELKLAQERTKKEIYRQKILEDAITAELNKRTSNNPEMKNFVKALIFQMKDLGYDIASHAYVTSKAGYVPKVRRGEFVAIASNGLEVTTFDNNKEKLVDEWIKNLPEGFSVEKLNKTATRQKYANLTTLAVENLVKERGRKLDKVLSNLELSFGADPKMVDVINDLKNNLSRVDSDLRNISAVRGDEFLKERKNVAGFDVKQYIPNALDYSKFKVYRSEKELTKAKVALDMTDKFFVENQQVSKQLGLDMEYMFNASHQEFLNLKKFTGVMYLLGGTKRWLVNHLQPHVFGFAVLQDRLANSGVGSAEATATYAKGLKTAVEYGSFGKTKDEVLNSAIAKARKEGAFGARSAEIINPQDEIFSSSTQAFDRQALGSVGSVVNRFTQVGNDIIKGFSKFDQISEQSNRQVSFIIGWEIANTLKLKTPKEKYDFALNYNMDVNFSGDKGNRPRFVKELGTGLGHAAALVPLSMRSFAVNSVSVLANMGWQGGRGFNYSTKERNNYHSRRGLYYAMGIAITLAGMSGIPFKDEASELLKKLGLDGDKYFKDLLSAHFGDTVATAFGQGLPFALGRVDLSTPLSTGVGLNAEDSEEKNLVSVLGGAPASASISLIKGLQESLSGDVSGAARRHSPTLVKQVVRAADFVKAGGKATDSRGVPISNKLKGLEIPAYLWGFGVKSVLDNREENKIRKETQMKFSEIKNQAELDIAKLLLTQNKEKAKQVMLGLKEKLKSNFNYAMDESSELSLVKGITDNILRLRNRSNAEPNAATKSALQQHWKATGQQRPVFFSEVHRQKVALGVSQMLGLDRVTAKQALSLPKTLQRNIVVDSLVQRGSLPFEAKNLLNKNKVPDQE